MSRRNRSLGGLADIPEGITGERTNDNRLIAPSEALFFEPLTGQQTKPRRINQRPGNIQAPDNSSDLIQVLNNILREIRFQSQALYFTTTQLNVSGVSIRVLTDNDARRYLIVQNKSTTDALYINFGARASSKSLEIAAGGNYEPFECPKNSVYLRGAAALSCVVVEGYLK